RPAHGIERHAEAVPVPVREDLLDIGADLATHGSACSEEWIVGWGRSVVVQPQNDAGEMGVVGRRPAKRIVDLRCGQKGTVRKILHPAPPSLIAHEYIELAVG